MLSKKDVKERIYRNEKINALRQKLIEKNSTLNKNKKNYF